MKRALCVGINDYPVRDADLKGCVNDARDWADLLERRFGFPRDNITLLLDEQATKANVLAAVDDLITGSKRGDSLVFTNSSHGTYVADESGDETRYDEAMCPWDMRDDLIVDDELRERFAALPPRVHLTVISDSCFSGSVTRGPVDTPDDRRHRFVNPRVLGRREIAGVRHVATPTSRERYPQTTMREVLLSGCRDNQYSFDARFGSTYHGAMTHHAIDIIEQADHELTYEELHAALVARLAADGFDQEPQLEGKSRSKRRTLFR